MPSPHGTGALDPRNWRDGSSRVWGAAWRAEEERDPKLQGVHWCLDLRLGSTHIRVASGPVRLLEASTGQSRAYRPTLADDLEVEESYEPGSAAGGRSVSIAVPNREVDAIGQVRAGFMLAGEAEIFLARDGGTYEDRLVVMDGDVTGGVSFGTGDGSMVRTKVSDPRGSVAMPITPYVIEPNRFPAAATSAYGARFPFVFGDQDGLSASLVEYDGVALSARALVSVPIGGAAVSAVYVGGTEYASGDAAYAWASGVFVDALGDAYLGVEFSGSHAWTGEESVTVDVSGCTETYLHQCIRYLLEGYTTLGRRRINYDLIGDLLTRLGAVDARLYANGSGSGTAATATSLIEGRLLESFPMVSMVTTDGRYGPVVTDARAPTRASLVRGIHLLNREAEIQESDKANLYNSFTLLYKYDPVADAYDAVATRTPTSSDICSRSAVEIGLRADQPIEAPEIEDPDVAGYVVDWLVYHKSMPSYYLEYSIPLAYLLRLRLGMNVALTDDQLSLDGVTAVVARRVIRRHVGVVGLRIYWPSLAGVGLGGGSSSGGSGGGGGGIG